MAARLAVATRPRGGDWLEDEARGWRRASLDVVISLLEQEEAAQLDLAQEAQAAEANGIRFLSFPIPDRGVPASTAAAVSLISDIVGALEQGKDVAVHCRQVIGRSGLIAAGVLMNSGVSPEQAMEKVSSARGRTIPETPDHRRWLEKLPSEQPVVTHL